MTINRRQLFAGAGAGVAILTLGDTILGQLDNNAFASNLDLDHETFGALDANALAEPVAPSTTFEAQNWANATIIYDAGDGYADGIGPVTLADGSQVSALTVNTNLEGRGDLQHTIILRSADDGVHWQRIAEMEPITAPEACWGAAFLIGARLYVLYTYNVDNIRSIPNNDNGPHVQTRVDSLGVIAYRSSTDGGYTWSERGQFDLPTTDIDLRNPWHGATKLFWTGCTPPQQYGDATYIGVTKMGTVNDGRMFDDTEAYMITMRETSPGELAFAMSSPIRSGYPNTEEPCSIVFGDGVMNVSFRTAIGKLGEAWSTDAGASWTVDWARDRYGEIVAQPRTNSYQLELPDGRFLLCGNNSFPLPNDGRWTGPRNPAYYRIGERVGNRLAWGAPKLLVWDNDPLLRISGPCFRFEGNMMVMTASDKKTARTLRYPMDGL